MSEEFSLFRKECMVYPVPPASSAAGHKADDWKDCVWRGYVHWARISNSWSLEFELDLGSLQISKFPPNFERLVLGCIDADFCT